MKVNLLALLTFALNAEWTVLCSGFFTPSEKATVAAMWNVGLA
jgi:hypothetical protein